jgi:transcriptional regulator with XRE-family HTH domain
MSQKIKMLRQQMGMSLQDMADASGLTKSYLSKVERGICVPSIAAAIKISTALKIDVGQLFSPTSSSEMLSVVRHNERLRIVRAAGEGSSMEALAAEINNKRMQPFIVYPPSELSDGPHAAGHAGEEFLYVLTWSIEIQFPDHREQLKKGDAIYFNALLPHCLRSAGKQQASALVVISYDQG